MYKILFYKFFGTFAVPPLDKSKNTQKIITFLESYTLYMVFLKYFAVF